MNKPESITGFRTVGTTPIRPDGLDKVTGRAVFGDDFKLPGTLYGKILRSPHAHARIKSIDTSKALALEGVFAVVTAADFPKPETKKMLMGEAGSGEVSDLSDNCMARTKALYDGHAVAAVAAKNIHVAEQALKLIDVDYEVLEPLLDVRRAMAAGAPVLHENFIPGAFVMPTEKALPNAGVLRLGNGDVEQGFSDADIIVEREFTSLMVHQGYIEPHAATAVWNSNGQVTIWTCTQGQFAIRDQVALIFNLPMSRVKVVPLEIGGGFGGKDTAYIEPVAAILSKKANRPVKMAMSRAEILRATGPSAGTYIRIKAGVKSDGSFTAVDLYAAYEAGAYPGGVIAPGCLTAITRYNFPNFRVEGYDVVVNKPRVKPYRAPGASPSNFAMESVIDELAQKLGMDPIDFRLKNAMAEGDRLPIGFPCQPLGSREMLRAVKDHPHYNTPLEGANRGRGFSYGFWFGAGLTSSAEIMVNTDGTVQVTEGSCDLSGTRLTLAMQAAEALGIDLEQITCSVGDTDAVGYSFQSVGSRTTFATGIAVYDAAQQVLAEMKRRAAMIWESKAEGVEYEDGYFTGGADQRLNFRELAAQFDSTGGPVKAQVTVNPEQVGFQIAAHLVDVEVDPDTGKVDILRYTAFQDAGKAVHPDFVSGQIQGGVVQGIGWALTEGYYYTDEGRLANTSLLDYRMPTALDIPMIETVILETPNPGHPYGVRGVGEAPIIPPPGAIANAIHDAVGVRMDVLPMDPGAVLKQILAQK